MIGPVRVLVIVLAGGNAAFLLGMLNPWLSLGACSLIALALGLLFGPFQTKAGEALSGDQTRLWCVALALALLLCLLGGEGRIFYANTDWQVRDAVLADLSRRPWPVNYITSEGARLVLRAPLGMYILPSIAGRLLGWRAAEPALLIQNTIVLAAIFMLLVSSLHRWRDRLQVFAIFVSFSGLDIIGQIIKGHFQNPVGSEGLVPSLEIWGAGFQYTSIITDLFWAPNHGLPAMAMAAIYIAWRCDQASSLMLAGVSGLCLLWSPLAVMGAAPFAIFAGMKDLRDRRIGWFAPGILIPLILGLLPVWAYLTLSNGSVIHGFTFSRYEFRFYPIFVLLEVLPLLYLAGRAAEHDGKERTDFYLCSLMLLIIPMYIIGPSNDFVMRASIFPIVVLALMASRGLSQDFSAKDSRRVVASLVIMGLGAFTPGFEIARSLMQPPNPPKSTDLVAAWNAQYGGDIPNTTYLINSKDLHQENWLFKQLK